MLVDVQWVGRPKKRWIDTVKDCLRKRGLDVRQAGRMVEVYEGECMGYSQGDELLTLMRCHSYMKPLGRNLSVAEPTTLKGKFSVFLPFFR